MEDENNCYKSFGEGLEANLVCLDESKSTSTSIKSYCGNDNIIEGWTSEVCPENAKSKISYHQCYNTASLIASMEQEK